MEIKGFEKGAEPYLEMQEEYSLWFERLEAISFSGCREVLSCMR